MASAAVAGPYAPTPATKPPSQSQSRRTSMMSSSVTSFQTAPLAASSAASAASESRESLGSQHTVGVRNQRGGQDALASVASAAVSSPYPTGAASGLGLPKGKERASDSGDFGGKPLPVHPVPIPPRLETLPPQTYYTPPSPPPSVSPTDERTFDNLQVTPKKSAPVFCETPAALTSDEQERVLSVLESTDYNASPKLGAQRSGTLPVLPTVSFRPTEVPVAGSSASGGSGARQRGGSRASEDGSISTVTSSFAKVPAAVAVTGSDGNLLQPPPSAIRPTRRNTTGSSQRPSRNGMQSAHAHMSVQFPPGQGPSQGFSAHAAFEEATGELDSDILKEAEQIRAERRAKAQQAEEALTAPTATAAADEVPLVGHIIGEDHANYILMYNMLTGIRVAVSRCQAKIKKPLTDQDYTASHKYSFDVIGNELTPSAKYDFKFKDYAPNVFRQLREDQFKLDPSDYLVSLTAKYILSELGSPGKSGSFFYFSRDYRFIIKTLHHAEHKFLRGVLKQYHEHMKNNPHSLLSRFYGLHRVKLPRGRKIHFVIMNNLFPPHRDIHETYDLKGSTVGREYPEERIHQGSVLKDLNWIHRGRSLELGPEKRALLTEQIRRDVELLKEINVMDYSLLIGIHNMQRGNRDNLRRNTLKVYSPSMPNRRNPASSQTKSRAEAIAIRKAMRESDPKALGSHPAADLPEQDPEDNKQFLFYQDEGGLRATDDANDPMDTIYYLGIIDICTPWTGLKRLENIWKGFKNDRHKISPVPSREYGDRFFAFMQAVMRGGEGGERFLEKPPERQKQE